MGSMQSDWTVWVVKEKVPWGGGAWVFLRGAGSAAHGSVLRGELGH